MEEVRGMERESSEGVKEELDSYADGSITSRDAKVPGWLKFVYIAMPIWGVIWFYLYWNGSSGWLDRGYWGELQKAAKTTYESAPAPKGDAGR